MITHCLFLLPLPPPSQTYYVTKPTRLAPASLVPHAPPRVFPSLSLSLRALCSFPGVIAPWRHHPGGGAAMGGGLPPPLSPSSLRSGNGGREIEKEEEGKRGKEYINPICAAPVRFRSSSADFEPPPPSPRRALCVSLVGNAAHTVTDQQTY
eukprot:Hpha_TRINITY_DN16076_c1_g1::TRINITY_DN16076_c1_g1_i10::g.119166::m.119166